MGEDPLSAPNQEGYPALLLLLLLQFRVDTFFLVQPGETT
jgi:hypothetical protein